MRHPHECTGLVVQGMQIAPRGVIGPLGDACLVTGAIRRNDDPTCIVSAVGVPSQTLIERPQRFQC